MGINGGYFRQSAWFVFNWLPFLLLGVEICSLRNNFSTKESNLTANAKFYAFCTEYIRSIEKPTM